MANGAFFATPEQVMEAERQARAQGFGQAAGVQNPMLAGAMGNLGYDIAGAIGGAFGAQMPQSAAVQQAQDVQQFAKGIDFSDRRSVISAAKRASDAGQPGIAAQLMQLAPEVSKADLQSRIVTDPVTGARIEEKFDPAGVVRERETLVGREPKAPTTTINLGERPVEKAAAAQYERILQAADAAFAQRSNIQRAKSLVEAGNVETGALEPIKLQLGRFAEAAGLPINLQGISDAESFTAVTKKAVLDGMESIKGAASEGDRAAVEQATIALGNTKEANMFLMDTMDALARRQQEQADFYTKWAMDHDGTVLGARRAWSERVNEVPLVQSIEGRPTHYYNWREQMLSTPENQAWAQSQGWSRSQFEEAVDELWKAQRK